MSTDQWEPTQLVRMRFRFGDGTEVWSAPVTRKEAELHFASALWLSCPLWNGRRVHSAAIVIWQYN